MSLFRSLLMVMVTSMIAVSEAGLFKDLFGGFSAAMKKYEAARDARRAAVKERILSALEELGIDIDIEFSLDIDIDVEQIKANFKAAIQRFANDVAKFKAWTTQQIKMSIEKLVEIWDRSWVKKAYEAIKDIDWEQVAEDVKAKIKVALTKVSDVLVAIKVKVENGLQRVAKVMKNMLVAVTNFAISALLWLLKVAGQVMDGLCKCVRDEFTEESEQYLDAFCDAQAVRTPFVRGAAALYFCNVWDKVNAAFDANQELAMPIVFDDKFYADRNPQVFGPVSDGYHYMPPHDPLSAPLAIPEVSSHPDLITIELSRHTLFVFTIAFSLINVAVIAVLCTCCRSKSRRFQSFNDVEMNLKA